MAAELLLILVLHYKYFIPGRVAQSVLCLAADTCLTADQGIASSISAWSEFNHELISMAILLPYADSRRAVVSNKRKYVHEVLVTRLVKLAKENVWLEELSIRSDRSC